MKILEKGVFSNKEIADWFGISPVTFSRTKEERLKILKDFADYEITSTGKIRIKHVRIPVYVKQNSKTLKYYLTEVPKVWTYNEPETCSRVAAKVFNPKNNIKHRTGYEYTRLARNGLWGKPDKDNPSCYYALAKMYKHQNPPEDNTYELLTQEDLKIHNELFDQYFKYKPNATIVQDKVKNGEISKEEAYDELFPEDAYVEFLSALSDALQCDWVVKATIVAAED